MKSRKITSAAFRRRLLTAGSVCAFVSGSALAVDTTYTQDADFALGTLQSVNYDPPNSDQLQVSTTIQTLPLLYVANAGEDTLSKIDVDDVSVFAGGCEVARYRTWFAPAGNHSPFAGPAPSRTAVDQDGNVYVVNRHFDGRPASVMKILAEGGIDRNGNGVIDTSTDANGDCVIQPSEIIPLTDSNPNGVLEDSELADERVAWIRQVGPNNGIGRSLCIDPTDGNVYVGLYNAFQYYKLDTDGNLMDADGSGPNGYIGTSARPYGCVVDAKGNLFSATLSTYLGVVDVQVDPPVYTRLIHGGTNYGIGLGNGFVYIGQAGNPYIKYAYDPNNPAGGSFSVPATTTNPSGSRAVSVDGAGDVVQGRTPINKYAGGTDVLIWSTPNPVGFQDQRGVIPDSNQDIWSINLNSSNVTKFDGVTGAWIETKPVGASPYTYSDASGSTLALTNPLGRWTVTTDGGTAGTNWNQVTWNTEPQGSVPPGTSITVEARAADSTGGLAGQIYVPVSNGGDPGVSGQFLEVRATLTPGSDGNSPVLSDLTVSGQAPFCDVDADGDVDRFDIRLIALARNTSASGPGDPRDPDGDGIITANDARQCVLQCTNPRCAP